MSERLSGWTYDFIDGALVGVEVEGETGVAVKRNPSVTRSPASLHTVGSCHSLLLNQDARSSLDGLRSNAAL